ncbi:hypothetical protein [Spiroplasma endosymbiont of Villa modesta]|uniref:hypothetical protein n=1 Tax=Spiroplasma endosymbiont of Villa modesta TaxID=3066293 RepID=UPI00313CFBC3
MKKINIDKTILRFSNGTKLNKRNVNINWLEKIRNFIDIAYEDKINGYWWIKKFPFINSKTFNYNKNYGYDTNLYPGK